jgi:aspartyl-tRNA(Asn)/glutamyl-tRNA(Gln) amidotransferase subunit A
MTTKSFYNNDFCCKSITMIYRTIKELREAYISGITTPDKYINELFDVVTSMDESNQSIVRLNKDYALKSITQLSKDTNLPLWGIPCLIKDNILVEGLEVNAQSKILKGYIAAYTSDVAQSLIDAGAIIIGYTNMDEFAFGSSTEYSGYGQVTKNANDSERVAGGTSGGSAVAVALNIVPFALGTDTGGSVRQPASFNGVYGFRPTYGAVSRYGVIASASSFDQVGPIANSVEDIELVYSVLKGKQPKDQTSINITSTPTTYKLRVGICKEFVENLEDQVELKFKTLISTLSSDYELVDISLPHTKYILPVYYILQTVEAASNLERFDQIRYASTTNIESKDDLYFSPRSIELGEEVKRRIMLGTYTSSAGYYDAYYNQACKVRKIIQDEYSSAFDKVDVLLMPACPFPAWKIGEKSMDPMAMYTADIMTVSQPIAKLPAMIIPLSKDNELPVGLQLVGAEQSDEELLRIAKKLELVYINNK